MKYFMKDMKKNKLYCQLISVKEKPLGWLGKKSLILLDCHIKAYILGCISEYEESEDCFKWYNEFEQKVCDICVGGNGCYGVVNAILACGYNDETGFDYYYKLLDLFIEENVITEQYNVNEKSSFLKDNIEIVKMNKEQMYLMAEKYICEHRREIFHLPEKKELTADCEIFLRRDFETDIHICAIYDGKFTTVEQVLEKIDCEKDSKRNI